MVIDPNKNDQHINLPQRLLSAFKKMLREEELVGACFAEI